MRLVIIVFLINHSIAQVVYPGGGATGTRCVTKGRESGTCKRFLDCPTAREDIVKGIYPTICSYGSGGIRSINVCCPKRDTPIPSTDHFAKYSDVCGRVSIVSGPRFPQQPPTTPISLILSTFKPSIPILEPLRPIRKPLKPEFELKPHKLHRPHVEFTLDRLNKRSLVEQKPPPLKEFLALHHAKRPLVASPDKVTEPVRPVVGGQDAQRQAWPWMALLGKRRGAEYEWFCGGALITNQHILTAAHCFTTVRKPDVVRLGEHDLSKTSDSAHIDVSARAVYTHKGFASPSVTDDIAIVKLSSPVAFSDYVRPLCMPLSDITPASVGVRGTITGWGTLSFGGRSSDILQQVSVPIGNKEACEAAYSRSFSYKRNFPQGFPDNLFCASEEGGGKDACQGDSGGPFMINDGGRYRVVGVVSAGQGCGSKTYPGLYTWVFPYLQWMQETVAK